MKEFKKGYITPSGFMGYVSGRYILFASESDYMDYPDHPEETETGSGSLHLQEAA